MHMIFHKTRLSIAAAALLLVAVAPKAQAQLNFDNVATNAAKDASQNPFSSRFGGGGGTGGVR